jgi:flagellar motor protein MotB
MENLLNLLKQALGDDFASLVSRFLDEPEPATQRSLTALLPALLGGISQQGATPDGAASLLNLLKGSDIDAGLIDNIADLFSGSETGANELVNLGAGLVNQLFGNKGSDLSEALSSVGGIKSFSATKLLALAAPMVLSFLKKYIFGKNLDENSLASLLTGQGKYLEGLLDNSLVKALGFASPAAFLSGFTRPTAETKVTPAYVPEEARSTSGRWLPWLLLLIGLLGLLYLWQAFSKPKQLAQVPATVKATVVTEVTLPAKVYFDVDQAVIGDQGKKVLGDVIQVIKKDGGMKVDITGFTDKTGDPDKNLELAKQRAQAVREALVAAGVPEGNITMKPPFFVTGSGTDAEARRVEINKSQ